VRLAFTEEKQRDVRLIRGIENGKATDGRNIMVRCLQRADSTD
jgi:hypothetical protein